MKEKIVIIGGGAAGFFSAINIAEKNREAEVLILERSDKLLYKVEISGGGRCNLTHQSFEPSLLVKNYPRGHKELLSVFFRFQPKDTIEWFAKRGVQVKTEADGRMFPVSDSSRSIIDCFMNEVKKYNIRIETNNGVEDIQRNEDGSWIVSTSRQQKIRATGVVVCTGSTVRMWKILAGLGHTIQPPVASLFTFNIKDEALHQLMGTTIEKIDIQIEGTKLNASGPLLVTHWGVSGPAILKLSAWGARELALRNYRFNIIINWTGGLKTEEVKSDLDTLRKTHPKKQISNSTLYGLTNRFWLYLIAKAAINPGKNWADLNGGELNSLCETLVSCRFPVTGKSTFKDEFVTCGGITLKEVDFKTMQSKLNKDLYFAGEVLDIDAITGGYNFQSAWSTSWIVSESLTRITQ